MLLLLLLLQHKTHDHRLPSQVASRPEAQHDADASDVAQCAKCQRVNDSEACVRAAAAASTCVKASAWITTLSIMHLDCRYAGRCCGACCSSCSHHVLALLQCSACHS